MKEALVNQKPRWNPHEDDLINECICPALQCADKFQFMSGFWTSGIIEELSVGLASLINKSKEASLELLISPTLTREDKEAIEEGTSQEPQNQKWLEDFFLSEEGTRDALQLHTRACIANLLRTNKIIIKTVYLNQGIFHKKDYIISDKDSNTILLSGSSNATKSGILVGNNSETMNLYRSWGDPREFETIQDAKNEFHQIRDNAKKGHKSISLPKAISERLVDTYNDNQILSPEECSARIREKRTHQQSLDPIISETTNSNPLDQITKFEIPKNLEWKSGDYSYQESAVNSLIDCGNRGILNMCTGAGKTKTALIFTTLASSTNKLVLVVAAPTKVLIDQWCDDIKEFGITPFSFNDKADKKSRLRGIRTEFDLLEDENIFNSAIVMTHDALNDCDYMKILSSNKEKIVLVIDEAHGLTPRSLENIPECMALVGLSATPERYDLSETSLIVDKIGKITFKIELKDLIGITLVPYQYHLRECELTIEEYNEYLNLSQKIVKLQSKDDNSDIANLRKMLLRKRRMIYECTDAKIRVWRDQVSQLLKKGQSIDRSLVYTSQKDPSQIKYVNSFLASENIKTSQITCDENALDRKSILDCFKNGKISVLTSKRILDEGVNVPSIQRAFLLASQTTPREWIQRRGRCLRRSTGKKQAAIYDYIVTPPIDVEDKSQALKFLANELVRCQSFIDDSIVDEHHINALKTLDSIQMRYQ